MESMVVYGNRWGKTKDVLTKLSGQDLERLQVFSEEHKGAPIHALEKGHGQVTFSNGSDGVLSVRAVESRSEHGGNAWNAITAMDKVVGELNPNRKGDVRFHANAIRERINHVVSGPNGGEPLYFTKSPVPEETGSLPDASHVLLSSAGPDVFKEIGAYYQRNPKGHLYLAPGSRQVERGIPKWVFEQLQLLSCNRREATALADHLGAKSAEWTPKELLAFFSDLGTRQVRITDGVQGVHAKDRGEEFIHVHGVDRKSKGLEGMVQELTQTGIANEHTKAHPNVNGCGDTRLGAELGMEIAGEMDLRKRLAMGNILAALNTHNPGPNIARFPGKVIREARELLAQLS